VHVLLAAAGEQVAEAEHHALEARDADQLPAADRVGEPRVESGLHVHVVVPRPGLLDDVERTGTRAQVLGEHPRQPRPVPRPRGADHRAQSPAGEPADVGQLRPEVVPSRGSVEGHARRERAVGGPSELSGHEIPPPIAGGGR
jgi:hypothetical protein